MTDDPIEKLRIHYEERLRFEQILVSTAGLRAVFDKLAYFEGLALGMESRINYLLASDEAAPSTPEAHRAMATYHLRCAARLEAKANGGRQDLSDDRRT